MPSNQGRTVVIWNANAGSAPRSQAVRERLVDLGDVEILELSAPEETEAAVQRAIEQGATRVVAAGGDGTIHQVVNGMLQAPQRATLGILPLGTGNDLSRTLKIPLDIDQALEVLQHGSVQPLDLVRLRTPTAESIFANVAGAGNSSRVLENVTDELKQRWGPWCYLRGAIQVLTDLSSYRVTMRLDDGEPQQLDAWNVIVANGKTIGGGVEVAPQADPSDGLLDIVVVLDSSPLDMAAIAAEFLMGDYTNDERILFQKARRLHLQLEPSSAVIADGEPLEGSCFDFSVLPSAVSVLVSGE